MFPLTLTLPSNQFSGGQFPGAGITLNFNSGLTTLLGPNGSGKTSVLKVLRDNLKGTMGRDTVRYISAGRMGILEAYRSNNTGTGQDDPNNTNVGNYSQISYRKQSETAIGDFLTLESRSDILLKVEARLQGLFGKTLKLSWTQSGLKIEFKNLKIGARYYGAGNEASGLTQLVAMLAALYDDEIKYLLLDEPEVSLHPQLQSFILKEILSVAGDPNIPGKKMVVISTHSPAMLHLKKSFDLVSVIFFKSSLEHPIQVNSAEPLLITAQFRALIIRLSEIYKIAFFAKNILLSEGVSDEYVISALTDITEANFESTGVQVVPVSGKSELVNMYKLFNLVGKKICILADLDVLDDSVLIRYIDNNFLQLVNVQAVGYQSLETLYNEVCNDLNTYIQTNWTDIETQAQSQTYWRGNGSTQIRQFRSALSFLSSSNAVDIATLPNQQVWNPFYNKLLLLLDLLDLHDLVLIRRGSIEDCYINTSIPTGNKPIDSSTESDFLITNRPPQIQTNYSDVLKAINNIKVSQSVDQAALLRGEIGKVLGQITANLTDKTTDEDIANALTSAGNGLEKIFEITKTIVGTNNILTVKIISPLFQAHPHTFTFATGETMDSLQQKLPS